jgi:hypothetical protein
VINMRMFVLAAVFTWCGAVYSQRNGPLMPEDGAQLVEALPQVLKWAKKGGCPVVMGRGEYPNALWYAAQRFCNTGQGGGVIGYFSVDRWTGEVGTSPDRDEVFDSDALRELRRRLLRQRYAARLSMREAACLVRWTEGYQRAKAQNRCPALVLRSSCKEEFVFDLLVGCGGRTAEKVVRTYRVGRDSGEVRGQGDGHPVPFADVARVARARAKLLSCRNPARIDLGDAIALAKLVPRVVDAENKGLRPEVTHWPELSTFGRIWVHINTSRAAKPQDHFYLDVRVNVFDGAVQDARTLEVYDSILMDHWRRKILGVARERRQREVAEAKLICVE